MSEAAWRVVSMKRYRKYIRRLRNHQIIKLVGSPHLMPTSPYTHQQMTGISSDGIVMRVAALCVVCEYMIVGDRRKLRQLYQDPS